MTGSGEYQALRERWMAGESLRDLAAEVGVTRERMRQLLVGPCDRNTGWTRAADS